MCVCFFKFQVLHFLILEFPLDFVSLFVNIFKFPIGILHIFIYFLHLSLYFIEYINYGYSVVLFCYCQYQDHLWVFFYHSSLSWILVIWYCSWVFFYYYFFTFLLNVRPYVWIFVDYLNDTLFLQKILFFSCKAHRVEANNYSTRDWTILRTCCSTGKSPNYLWSLIL